MRLTEEQFSVLDLLAENDRCLLEGAAGTGKTMLALEYTRRSSGAGKRTLLICFNRLLGSWLDRQVGRSPGLGLAKAGSYFKLLREVIMRSSIAGDFLEEENRGDDGQLYGHTYPDCAKLALGEMGERYEALVMDEAQDLLRPDVLGVLDLWLEGGLAGGRWAIFGDFQQQALFGDLSGAKLREGLAGFAPEFGRGRLTINCRNSTGTTAGPPVNYHFYNSRSDQESLALAELRRLLDGGVSATDVVVLSRLRLPKSGVATLNGGNQFRLADVSERIWPPSQASIVRFATAHAFKGMESPIVILCDIDQVTGADTQKLLYVAMSRARSQLTILAHDRTRTDITGLVHRRLQER